MHPGDWTLTQALAGRGDLGSNYHQICFRLRRFTIRQTAPSYPTTSRALSAQRETGTLTLLSSCHLRWVTINWRRMVQPPPRVGRLCTMLGRKTLPPSTSSLDRRLWWVRIFLQSIYFLFSLHERAGERNLYGTGWVCLFPWRTLWSLSWIQRGLLPGDHLLGNREDLQEFYLETQCSTSLSWENETKKVTRKRNWCELQRSFNLTVKTNNH